MKDVLNKSEEKCQGSVEEIPRYKVANLQKNIVQLVRLQPSI